MEDVKTIFWYHPQATRHIAESLLQNAQDGAYLLRDSSHEGDLALSVRCKDSVKHFNVTWLGEDGYKFGMGVYATLKEFINHFDNQPLIAGESGVLTRLKFPYPRDVEEPNMYETVRIHAEIGRTFSIQDNPNFSLASKEGYLTKLGGIVKNWKTRWFVLQKYELKYYKEKNDVEPVRRLDLTQCELCATTKEVKRENCFKLVFPWRTFYMYAATEDELKEWIKILKWKLEQLQKDGNCSPPVQPCHVIIESHTS